MSEYHAMFPQSYPEKKGAAGETVVGKPLRLMRRQQLHDVARAWEIPVENGGTKTDILPVLLAEEKAGTFNHPPKHPEIAAKAMVESDFHKPSSNYSA